MRRLPFIGVAVAVLLLSPGVPSASAAAPDRSGMEIQRLWAVYGTHPLGQPGTGEYVQVWAEQWWITRNGELVDSTPTLTVAVYEGGFNEIGDALTVWSGEYQGTQRQIEFGPRDVTAEATLTWHCSVGACPTMPAVVHFMISARAAGNPETEVENVSTDSRTVHSLRQQTAASITVDSGGAIALPPLLVGYLEHRLTTNHDKAGV